MTENISPEKYKKSDFKRVSWEEYAKTLEILGKKVGDYLKKENIKIDAIVPIMRGGAFPGTYLAYRLAILAILPVQYKYFFKGNKMILKRLTDYPQHKFNFPKHPTFLIVEGNHCFGTTAKVAIDDLKKRFSGCKILYAVDHEDASFQKMEDVEANFWGKLTDETRLLSDSDAKKMGVEKGVSYLMPWENLDEEWTTVQGKQFEYFGASEDGEEKMKIDLG